MKLIDFKVKDVVVVFEDVLCVAFEFERGVDDV